MSPAKSKISDFETTKPMTGESFHQVVQRSRLPQRLQQAEMAEAEERIKKMSPYDEARDLNLFSDICDFWVQESEKLGSI